jgi:hypothetical protein
MYSTSIDHLRPETEKVFLRVKNVIIEAERSVASLYRKLEKTQKSLRYKVKLINDNSCIRI